MLAVFYLRLCFLLFNKCMFLFPAPFFYCYMVNSMKNAAHVFIFIIQRIIFKAPVPRCKVNHTFKSNTVILFCYCMYLTWLITVSSDWRKLATRPGVTPPALPARTSRIPLPNRSAFFLPANFKYALLTSAIVKRASGNSNKAGRGNALNIIG